MQTQFTFQKSEDFSKKDKEREMKDVLETYSDLDIDENL